jgi:hypothetical protein
LTSDEIVQSWNEVLGPLGLPRVTFLNDFRKSKLRQRLKEHPDFDFWNRVFNRIGKSKFLQGENARNWRCSFDFLINNDTNAIKIYEGQYDQEVRPNGKVQAVR